MDTAVATVPTPHYDARSILDEANRPEVLVFVLHEPTSTGETPLGACTTSCLAIFGFSLKSTRWTLRQHPEFAPLWNAVCG